MTPQEKADLLALAIDWISKKATREGAEASLVGATAIEDAASALVVQKMAALNVNKVWASDLVLESNGAELTLSPALNIG